MRKPVKKIAIKKQWKKVANKIWLIFLAGVILLIILLILSSTLFHQKSLALSKDPLQPPYSKKEIHTFWEQNFQTIFTNLLFNYQYPIPEIGQRVKELNTAIQKRYHQNLKINLQERYLAPSQPNKYVFAGSTLSAGTSPTIYLSVPALMIAYQELQKAGQLEKQKYTEINFLIGFIHELDHLAGGYVIADKKTESLEKLVECEKRAWAETCEKTIRILVEDYQLKLSPTERIFYEQWLKAGRNANNPSWQEFIKNTYTDLYRR